MSADDTTPVRWECACGEWTSVTHWAWPDGVAVHDPDLAFSEAAGLAQQGGSDEQPNAQRGRSLVEGEPDA